MIPQSTNPFDIIIEQNNTIINRLQALIVAKNSPQISMRDIGDNRTRYMTLTEIWKQKLISKPTFYKLLKEGKITMYKLGERSYVDKLEFESAFKKVELSH